MSRPALHVVRCAPPRRRSLIVDVSDGQDIGPPLPLREMEALDERALALVAGAYLASWAAAIRAPLRFDGGEVYPDVRNSPAPLIVAYEELHGALVGSLGVSVPVMRDRRGRPFLASWRTREAS